MKYQIESIKILYEFTEMTFLVLSIGIQLISMVPDLSYTKILKLFKYRHASGKCYLHKVGRCTHQLDKSYQPKQYAMFVQSYMHMANS